MKQVESSDVRNDYIYIDLIWFQVKMIVKFPKLAFFFHLKLSVLVKNLVL